MSRAILVALPTSSTASPPDPTSYRVRADCGHEVWIASTSRALLIEHDPLIVCHGCRPRGSMKPIPPTAEQRAALHAAGMTDRDIRRAMRRVRRGG